jgi:hypothetical protein
VGSEGAALDDASDEGAAEDDDAAGALDSTEPEALGSATADDETAAELVALGAAGVKTIADEEGVAETLALEDSAVEETASEEDCDGTPDTERTSDGAGMSVIAGPDAETETAADSDTDAVAAALDVGTSPGAAVVDTDADGVELTLSEDAVADGAVVSVVAPEALEAGGAPGATFSGLTCTVHLVTFSNASLPAASLMGVKVISHVSIRIPAGVTVSFVVVSWVWLLGACLLCKGRALAWAENKNKRAKRAKNVGLVGRIAADNIVKVKRKIRSCG